MLVPLAPVVTQPKHAPSTLPAPRGVPLLPSDVWDEIESVVWNVLPRSPFHRAAMYLKFPMQPCADRSIDIDLTLTDVLLVIAYTRLPTMPTR